jgi:hypothetical protein
MFLGRTGFFMSCSEEAAFESTAPCAVHKTDTDGVSSVEAFTPLTNHSGWDGRLTVLRPGQAREKLACAPGGFFLAYQPLWGAASLRPASLPSCLHLGGGRFGLRRPDGSIRPILWVLHGAGLHEYQSEFVYKRPSHHTTAASVTLAHFSEATLRSDVVWQPSGGHMHLSGNRDMLYRIPPTEIEWLRGQGVRWWNYSRISEDFAALMVDDRHFTHYLRQCRDNFPQMSEVAARLTLNTAFGLQATSVCAPVGQ